MTASSAPVVQALPAAWLGEVLSLLAEASAWSSERGSLQWTAAELDPAIFLGCIAREELFGLITGGDLIGCILLQDEDDTHWPERPRGEALYIHKLAVRRSEAGRGMGDRLIDFACRMAACRGRGAVRLDTQPLTRLEEHYRRLGFVRDPAGPCFFAGRWLIRMEKLL